MKAKHINQFLNNYEYLSFHAAPAATDFSRLKRSGFMRTIISRVSAACFMLSLPTSRFPVFRLPTLFSPTDSTPPGHPDPAPPLPGHTGPGSSCIPYPSI